MYSSYLNKQIFNWATRFYFEILGLCISVLQYGTGGRVLMLPGPFPSIFCSIS